jgi:hypothetical protein
MNAYPTLTNNTLQNNDRNGFCLSGGTIENNETWDITDTSYLLLNNATVFIGKTLTVDPDVVVKFVRSKRLTIDGTLRALGTLADPVYFTSYRDDTIGGDTNGDGASNGVRGDWYDIRFADTSDDTNSIIDHAEIRYGGDSFSGNYSGAVSLLSASPTIQNSTITENEYTGIYSTGSQPEMSCNNIYNNHNTGVYNSTPGIIVNAENTWWGSKTGPNHPTLNPAGVGNSVSDGVDFIPWLTAPCGLPEPQEILIYLPIILR